MIIKTKFSTKEIVWYPEEIEKNKYSPKKDAVGWIEIHVHYGGGYTCLYELVDNFQEDDSRYFSQEELFTTEEECLALCNELNEIGKEIS